MQRAINHVALYIGRYGTIAFRIVPNEIELRDDGTSPLTLSWGTTIYDEDDVKDRKSCAVTRMLGVVDAIFKNPAYIMFARTDADDGWLISTVIVNPNYHEPPPTKTRDVTLYECTVHRSGVH